MSVRSLFTCRTSPAALSGKKNLPMHVSLLPAMTVTYQADLMYGFILGFRTYPQVLLALTVVPEQTWFIVGPVSATAMQALT